MEQNNDIREYLFKSKVNSKVVEFGGRNIEVRPITLKTRGEIVKAANVEGVADPVKFQVLSVIYCCYYPGTDKQVFSIADMDALMASEVGGFCDILFEEVQKKVNLNVDDAKKN